MPGLYILDNTSSRNIGQSFLRKIKNIERGIKILKGGGEEGEKM
jgi:hypothetical protein